MFNHSHLPNIGLTEGKIPTDIYQALNKEIVDIHMASETGSLVVFTKGVRGGKYYEDDTFRLEKKLI